MNNLLQKSKSASIVMITGQFFRLVSQIIGLVVLARFLSPDDYGVTAIVIAIIGIGETIRELGLGNAMIQDKSITNAEKSNLFWLNFSLGLFFFVTLYFLSPFISSFFHEDRLLLVSEVLSITFLLNGISTQYRAGLSRELKFRQVTMSDTFAAIISTMLAIYSATHGMKYWSIVIQQLTQSSLLVLFYAISSRWLPSLPDFKLNIRRFTDYGLNLMGAAILGQLSRSVDSLIIGHSFGSEVLGFYNRAQQIIFMGLLQIGPPSTTLAVPILSKLQNEPFEFNKYLIFGQSILLHVVCLFFSYLLINSDWIVVLVLGEQWTPSIIIVQILAISAIFYAAEYPLYWIYLSKAYMKDLFRVTLITRPLLILAMFIGSLWSINYVCIAYVLGLIFIWIYSSYRLKNIGFPMCDVIKNSVIVSISYLISLLITLSANYLINLNLVHGIIFKNVLMTIVLLIIYIFIVDFRKSINLLFSMKNFYK